MSAKGKNGSKKNNAKSKGVGRNKESRVQTKLSQPQRQFINDGDPQSRYLSSELCDYAASLANPFDSEPAGMPVFPIIASQKLKTMHKNYVVTSSNNGNGFLMIRPVGMTTNDTASIFTTDSTSTPTSFQVAGTGIVSGTATSPFTTTNFTADETQQRVVAVGLRWRYVGTELDRGGVTFAIVTPDHRTLVGMNDSDISKYDQCMIGGATRDWNYLVWRAVTAAELAYTSAVSLVPSMGVWIKAPLSSSGFVPSQYFFEVFCIFEASGVLARGATVTQPDDDGFQAAQAVLTTTKAAFADIKGHTRQFFKDLTVMAASRAARIGMSLAAGAVKKAAVIAAASAVNAAPLLV